MNRIIEKGIDSLFLFGIKILGAIIVACAAYIAVQMVGKILINTITKM